MNFTIHSFSARLMPLATIQSSCGTTKLLDWRCGCFYIWRSSPETGSSFRALHWLILMGFVAHDSQILAETSTLSPSTEAKGSVLPTASNMSSESQSPSSWSPGGIVLTLLPSTSVITSQVCSDTIIKAVTSSGSCGPVTTQKQRMCTVC